MRLQVIKNRVLYWTKSVILYTLYTIVLFLIAAFFILQLPAVQTALSKRFLSSFSNVVGFNSTIKEIQFFWFDRISASGILIKDPENNNMIAVKNITVNFEFATLLEGSDINIDAVSVDSAHVYLKYIQESDTSSDLNINLFIAEIRKNYQGQGGDGKTPRIAIGEAFLTNSGFAYDRPEKDSIQEGFDYHHFNLDIPDAELQNFVAIRDTVEFRVTSLNAIDKKTSFDIKRLSTFFRISQRSMEFKNVDLLAGKSTIRDTVIFRYDKQLDLNDFVNKVQIQGNLTGTVIYPEDLAHFAPPTARITQPLTVDGKFNGMVSKFIFSNMRIQMGSTLLQGTLDMDGLPDFVETFIRLNLKKSQIRFTDFDFAFKESVLKRLRPLGVLSLDGEFLGYPTDFVANGDFYSDLGRFTSDINFKVNEEAFDRSAYKGKLTVSRFDLGAYLNDTTNFQRVSLDGQISGAGLTQSTANFILNGKISSLGIRGYTYRGITTNARFASQFFNGEVIIKDPNLELQAIGAIDLRNNRNQFNIKANIDTANFYRLKLSKVPLFLQTRLNINFHGLQLDSLSGDAYIDQLQLRYKDQSLAVRNLDVKARKNGKERSLEVRTNLIDARVSGGFTFTQLFKDVRAFTQEFILNIKNDRDALAEYYEKKTTQQSDYVADFYFKFSDLEPVTKLLDVDLNVSSSTEIEGSFSSGGRVSKLQAYTLIDTLRYQDNTLVSTEIEINASKISDSTNVLAMAYINSQHQQIGKALNTENFVAEGIWNEDHIDFDINLDQQNTTNYIELHGDIDFKDSTNVHLDDRSKILLLDKTWLFHKGNTISKRRQEWTFRDLTLQTGLQYINLDGRISTDANKSLTLQVSNFDLSSLNDLSQRPLSGKLDADITLADYYHIPSIQNKISINQLRVGNFLIGDITGNNIWDTERRVFDLEFYIDRLENRIVNCTGTYNPSARNPLNVKAAFDKANLRIFEPFLDEIFSKFEGTLTGTYDVYGSLAEPRLNGVGKVEQGQLQVNYLKTVYQFTGFVGLTPNSIYFQNIELRDAYRNSGTLEGRITHRNFRSMQISMNANIRDFQVLNTTARDNELFYGQGYASGDVSIEGPLNNLKITSTAKTEKNTRIYIPIGGTSSGGDQKDFINFVDFSDSTFQATFDRDVVSKVDLTGITMDFNLDVTPDAYCEIIFDIKAGDIIRGRGNGKIKLQLDTKGDFNMFGPIEFTEGAYNFTLYDIINKEFEIQSGSSITWFGDPYQGTMRINATYNQLASLSPIIAEIAPVVNDQSITNLPQVRRKYPVQVLLKLEGPMLSPLINFDIVAKDLPQTVTIEGAPPLQLQFMFNAFKNRLDEQELKRQVFSLIVLRRFSPLESFNTSGTLVNSVSELFSNQLSYWMSQVDENLEIDVDLGTMDLEAFNTFQLRLSYTFLNGRLRVTRDGTFGNTPAGTTGSGKTDLSSVAGDWTVDYLLTPDGKFKVKMYSRTNSNIINSLGNQSAVTTGVSLLHTQSFNELKDLLRSSRDKHNKNAEDESDNNEEGTKEDNTEGGHE